MGSGEQRGIHAFFRKDFGVPTLPSEPVNDAFLRPTALESNGSSTPQPSVAALDHDPNSDRRKRRKTTRTTEDAFGDGTITNNGDSTHNDCKSPAQRTVVSVEVHSPTQENKTPQPLKKQKVIKLNANGKLLSSPVADKFADKSKKKGSKRGKAAQQHNNEAERKLVIIKYTDNKGSSERLGQQIDEILCGRKKYIIPNRAEPPTPAPPKPTLSQPAKATHPFFSKKTAPKPDAPISHPPDQEPFSTSSEDRPTNRSDAPHPPSTPRPFTSFKHSFAKVPEPVHSLWPPHGFTHVRDFDDEVGSENDEIGFIEADRKKSKTPAIKVNDDENVLALLGNSRDDRSALREPSKRVMSGRALQTTIANRLTRLRAGSDADVVSSKGVSHPAVAKLFDSLTDSTTPFDRGGYETQAWTQKYAPSSAQEVLCATKEALMLRDWLKHLIVSSVEIGNSSKDSEKAKRKEEKKRKRRKKSEKLDGFIVSSEDEANEMGEISGSEDELAGDVTVSNKRTVIRTGDLTFNLRSNERGRMTNAILLSGPSGCGKTASVYAVAKEMDFEVFEINPGQRRSAKDILDRIGDMTQNHLVHNLHESENPDPQAGEVEDAKQNKLVGFFKSTSTARKPDKPIAKALPVDATMKQTRSQKQSLILLEEADILFEEDKQFWSGVLTLINQSKRPIVITCNDESLIPLDDISFHAILRLRAQSQELAVDYLLLIAANEGHILERSAVEKLYLSTGSDLRRSVMELNYWCQMAVGSEKAGLDWLIDRWPQGVDLDSNGDKLRVLSEGTYDDYMGWFSRDVFITPGLATETEIREETLHWWQLSLQEADSIEDSRHTSSDLDSNASNLERLETLRRQSEYMESRSALDVLAASCSLDAREDAIDTSTPEMSEKQRLNYIEGYRLLHSDPVHDYTKLTLEVATVFQALLGKTFRPIPEEQSREMLPIGILKTLSKPKAAYTQERELLEALAPAMKPDCGAPPLNAGAELLFEHGQQSIAEDVSPYIRAIVAFDLRLEQYRRELSCVLSGNERDAKRARTTRASRAALEGGNKADTRKERWFSPAVNVHRVLATGKVQWQDLLVQNGYCTVPCTLERCVDGCAVYIVVGWLCCCFDLDVLRPSSVRLPIPPPLCDRSSSIPMSLFGTSPDDSAADSARRSKSSLFADEPSLGAGNNNFGGSSLFADDDGLGSPWNSNTGKRTSKEQLVKTLLPDSDVPESYIDAYDLVLSAGERAGTGVGLTSVRELLSGGGLSATDQAKILNLVLSGDTGRSNGLGRGEFNVLLALIGLAQEGEDLTFDTVDDRRRKLPVPRSSYLDALRAKQDSAMSVPSHDRPATPPAPSAPPQEPNSAQSRPSRRESLGGLESDPWGSPQLHRGHAHAQNEPEHGALNGFGSVRSATNAWSKTGDGENMVGSSNHANGRSEAPISNSAESGWGESFPYSSAGGGLGGPVRSNLADFGRSGSDHGESNSGRRPLNLGQVPTQVKEVVTVTLLQEKEGMFMFQHRNYEVKSARRGSTVVRRYSDFVWLLDCLHKRYPFRQLPLLPPKRISVNGTHLSADSTSFLEKRRRGLVRFTNSLVSHPVLSQEQLVVMFLTVPTELSVWRKQATISVQDEFAGRVLPPELEDSLPSTLIDTFDTVRSGVKRSAEVYINLCTLLERLVKRNEGLAADHLRFSLALQSLTEMTRDTYAFDTNDVALLNEGIKATARHLSASQSLLEDEARAWEEGMLEDLKHQRDNLVSVREMFDRRDRYARNNIPQLEKRIETNERKLQDLRARPQGTVKPGEIEKVEESIFKDKESIVQQHARGVFIKECIRDELTYFQQSQYHISRLHQDWSQERVKYSELQADNWRSLGDQVEGMPLGD
ncbi:sorting nexin Mvp1 [Aspergillus undulatus]|uniref:sorting nexin Mvp1 n=1 Tax=Aspergillus undulatus TaxID=1810928 RepID=UPI003CCD01A5